MNKILKELKQKEKYTLEKINEYQEKINKAKEQYKEIQADIEYYLNDYHKDIDVTTFPYKKYIKGRNRLENEFNLKVVDIYLAFDDYPFYAFNKIRKYIKEGFIPVCYTYRENFGDKILLVEDTDRTRYALDEVFFIGYADQEE